MDPDTALQTMRDLCAQAEAIREPEVKIMHLEALVAEFEALDEWLVDGGFYPSAWANEHDNVGRV